MEQWPFLSSGWLKNEVVDCNVKKEKRVFNNSNNDFEKSVVAWEWDVSRVGDRVGGNQSSTS